MSVPTRGESLGYPKFTFHEVFPFPPFFITQLWCVSLQSDTWKNKIRLYSCPADFRRSSHGQRAPGEPGSLMPHHDSSSNYWLMLFSSSVLATKHCSSLSKILTEKHQGLLTGENSQVELRQKSTYRSLQLLEISACNLENCSAIKAINDGCVHGKKKIERANSTVLTPAASMSVFPPFQPLWHTVVLGGKWKVLFAFCKYQDFHFRLFWGQRTESAFPSSPFITISLICSAFLWAVNCFLPLQRCLAPALWVPRTFFGSVITTPKPVPGF